MKVLPRGLFARFSLIIILPMLILICISTYTFYQRHWESVSFRLKEILANEIYIAINAVEMEDTKTPKILDFDICIRKDLKSLPITRARFEALAEKITKEVNRVVTVQLVDNGRNLAFYAKTDHGIIEIKGSIKRLESPTTNLFLLWLVGSALILITISFLYMKKQVESIVELSEFAEKLGKGQTVGHLTPSGALEIRKLFEAFIRMKGRIERQINYRTELLAHISHDLRTPLTRLKLELNMLKDQSAADGMLREINEMQQMIVSYLEFAKEEGTESSKMFDFIELINELKKEFEGLVIFEISDTNIPIMLRYEAVKRAIRNVLQNALKYKRSKVILTLDSEPKFIFIRIEDDGDGIPKKYRKKVFEPFEQIGGNKEGFGLGLSIVKNIIYGHGGKIVLGKSKLGGLNFKIMIPK